MNWYKKIILAGLPVFNERKFWKRLQEMGVEQMRRGPGSHSILVNPKNNKQTTFPRKSSGGHSINPKTMINILKQLDISLQEFMFDENIKQNIKEIVEPVNQETPEWQRQNWYIEQQKQLQKDNYELV